MLRRTPLKAKKRLNHTSVGKVEEINSQVEVRNKLCRRAGGYPVEYTRKVKINGIYHDAHIVRCYGGVCEICHEPQSGLEPHEKFPRGLGGKLSLENTLMVDRNCHNKQKGQVELRWVN